MMFLFFSSLKQSPQPAAENPVHIIFKSSAFYSRNHLQGTRVDEPKKLEWIIHQHELKLRYRRKFAIFISSSFSMQSSTWMVYGPSYRRQFPKSRFGSFPATYPKPPAYETYVFKLIQFSLCECYTSFDLGWGTGIGSHCSLAAMLESNYWSMGRKV